MISKDYIGSPNTYSYEGAFLNISYFSGTIMERKNIDRNGKLCTKIFATNSVDPENQAHWIEFTSSNVLANKYDIGAEIKLITNIESTKFNFAGQQLYQMHATIKYIDIPSIIDKKIPSKKEKNEQLQYFRSLAKHEPTTAQINTVDELEEFMEIKDSRFAQIANQVFISGIVAGYHFKVNMQKQTNYECLIVYLLQNYLPCKYDADGNILEDNNNYIVVRVYGKDVKAIMNRLFVGKPIFVQGRWKNEVLENELSENELESFMQKYIYTRSNYFHDANIRTSKKVARTAHILEIPSWYERFCLDNE